MVRYFEIYSLLIQVDCRSIHLAEMMQKDGEDSSTRRGREIEQANLRWRDKERKLRDDIQLGHWLEETNGVERKIDGANVGRDNRMKIKCLHDLFRKCCQQNDLTIR